MLCGLQVLRLWLERKIFPESVLRRYMNDIGGSGDDKTVKLSFRRPSRAERSVDDPIREMEGMLVDEYGRCGYWGHHFFIELKLICLFSLLFKFSFHMSLVSFYTI
jgi:hypothetical protein